MKVVFLDFDGVLNSVAFHRRDPGPMDRLDPEAIARLNTLVQRSGAKVVISSSWRLFWSLEGLRRLLGEVGFSGQVVDVTPDLRDALYIADGCVTRCMEIRDWLVKAEPEVENFVVLDDADLSDLAPHFVRTSIATGLLDEHIDLAMGVLA